MKFGEIAGKQGARSDIQSYVDDVKAGLTVNDILDKNPANYRNLSLIEKIFIRERQKMTPPERENTIFWHVGKTGTGKTKQAFDNIKKLGYENVFFVSGENPHPFDNYQAQKQLWIDELRANSPYFTWSQMLAILDRYTQPIPARYSDKLMLWEETHVLTPLLPRDIYRNLSSDDKIEQIERRIDYYVYHYKDDKGELQTYTFDVRGKIYQPTMRELIYNASLHQKQIERLEKEKPSSGGLGVLDEGYIDLSEYIEISG